MNKRTFLQCLTSFCFLILSSRTLCIAQKTPGVRQKILINREWKFLLGDQKDGEAAGLDDSQWNRVNLPHNFSMPYFQQSTWYAGYGWYRKHLHIPAAWNGKCLFLEFDGAFREAEIYLNGQKVGTHNSGYTGFSIDITKAFKTGDNLLAVRLSNRWNAQLAPRNGDHNFTGGIYRNVYLVATNKVHVTWYGTFVTTPELTRDSGKVFLQTEVLNDTKTTGRYTLHTQIIDPDGKQVDQFGSGLLISSGQTIVFKQSGHSLSWPKLWHPSHPFLYKAISNLYDANHKLVDRYETGFGFRWVEWTAEKGFYINGEHYYFKGANVHQDHAGWASAVTEDAMVRDVKLVKEAGFDFIRGSHYPHAPAFAGACDSLGVLFWSENNFWGCGGFVADGSWFSGATSYPVNPQDRVGFEENLKTSLIEMIRVNRNHPSIITWSMGNETFFTDKKDLPRVKKLLKELVALTRKLDPSRKVAIGGVQRGDIDKLGDIAGYNGDGARLFIDPGIPSVVSEYSSVVSDRPGNYDPGFGDLASQPEFEWRSGQAIWCAFDYGTHAGQLGHMGIVDYQRIPKRAWYWYRNAYRNIPPPDWPKTGVPAALKLTSDKEIISSADGTGDVQLLISILDKDGKLISNSPDVTLSLISGPGEFPTGSSITFSERSDIPIRDGQAAIEFRSYYAGQSAIKASSPGLKDAYLTILSKNAPRFDGGRSQTVTERPYTRFADNSSAKKPLVAEFANNKPTHVSTEEKDHQGRLANDRNKATFWQATKGDKTPWLMIDMENLVLVNRLKLDFPKNTDYQFKIQVSSDNVNWIDLVDQSSSKSTDSERSFQLNKKIYGRSLRLIYTSLPKDMPASLSEIEIYGEPQ